MLHNESRTLEGPELINYLNEKIPAIFKSNISNSNQNSYCSLSRSQAVELIRNNSIGSFVFYQDTLYGAGKLNLIYLDQEGKTRSFVISVLKSGEIEESTAGQAFNLSKPKPKYNSLKVFFEKHNVLRYPVNIPAVVVTPAAMPVAPAKIVTPAAMPVAPTKVVTPAAMPVAPAKVVTPAAMPVAPAKVVTPVAKPVAPAKIVTPAAMPVAPTKVVTPAAMPVAPAKVVTPVAKPVAPAKVVTPAVGTKNAASPASLGSPQVLAVENDNIPQIPGLSYRIVPGDGHCLFHAVNRYVNNKGPEELRNLVADHIEKNRQKFQGFRVNDGRNIFTYLQAIRNGTEWGSHLEIIALMEILKRPIAVVEGINGNITITNSNDLRQFNGEPIFVYYNGVDHYDALDLVAGAKGRETLNNLLALCANIQSPGNLPPVPAENVSNPAPVASPSVPVKEDFDANIIIKTDTFKKLEREIGSGGFGQVYTGEWYGTKVALKVLKAPSLSTISHDEFCRETNIMETLNHPNIVRFYGVYHEPNVKPNYGIVMEYMPMGSLYDVLHTRDLHLNWSVRYKIAADIGKGLDYLHQRKPTAILHLDLKSANVLLDNEMNAKLCDFGLAYVKKEAITEEINFSGDARKGTWRWMAPETLDDKGKYNEKADVYSYGIILWELATRKVPYQVNKENDAVIKNKIKKENYRPEIPDSCPVGLAKLIRGCWAGNYQKRPRARQVFEQLDKMRESSIQEEQTASNNNNHHTGYILNT